MARVERRRSETTTKPIDLYKEWKWAAWAFLGGCFTGGAGAVLWMEAMLHHSGLWP